MDEAPGREGIPSHQEEVRLFEGFKGREIGDEADRHTGSGEAPAKPKAFMARPGLGAKDRDPPGFPEEGLNRAAGRMGQKASPPRKEWKGYPKELALGLFEGFEEREGGPSGPFSRPLPRGPEQGCVCQVKERGHGRLGQPKLPPEPSQLMHEAGVASKPPEGFEKAPRRPFCQGRRATDPILSNGPDPGRGFP